MEEGHASFLADRTNDRRSSATNFKARTRLIIGLSAFLTPHPPPLLPPPSSTTANPSLGEGCPGREGGVLFLRFEHDRVSWPGDNWIPFKKKKRNPFVKRLLETVCDWRIVAVSGEESAMRSRWRERNWDGFFFPFLASSFLLRFDR